MKILIINGPNLNLLGQRETDIYGHYSFEDYFKHLQKKFIDVELEYYQTNHEGSIIDKIHEKGFKCEGIVINPGAYTHYSYAIHDAIKSVTAPSIEVHISDIEKREEFRKISVIKDACVHQIKGKGLPGYEEAIEYLIKMKQP